MTVFGGGEELAKQAPYQSIQRGLESVNGICVHQWLGCQEYRTVEKEDPIHTFRCWFEILPEPFTITKTNGLDTTDS